eukprot:TRINITY_DN5437_c0_g1_i1.p1 TRINITY_DN5437_c0_g1~~TRINITY_DN5437_c0_g1_i1.p1  ORF type:complete len:505 (-),score=116.39 TRINITY_DN5437_c0_g1_i1:11-1525(-)
MMEDKELTLLKKYKEKETEPFQKKRKWVVNTIRKHKREEMVRKERHRSYMNEYDDMTDETEDSDSDSQIDEGEFQYYLGLIHSDVLDNKIEGISNIRKALAKDSNPPIQQVIESGLVETFSQFLESQNDKVVFESAWALTNIASGSSDQTQVLIYCDVPKKFKQLLYHQNEDIREQAIWGLGNIAGESIDFRDYVLSIDVLLPVVENLKHTKKNSMICNGAWALSNFCRGKPVPDWNKVKFALEILPEIIRTTDPKVLSDACWTLSYLSDTESKDQLQEMIQYDFIDRLIELLLMPAHRVHTPALRTIGNILTGDNEHTEILVSKGVLPKLKQLLSSTKKTVVKEAVWTISNITAGTEKHIEAVLRTEIMPIMIHLIVNYEFDIKREALWAISNATSGNPSQVNYIVTIGGIEALCSMLGHGDPTANLVALEGIGNIMRNGEQMKANGINPYAYRLEKCGGIEKLESLQEHLNPAIYKKSCEIMESYLGAVPEFDPSSVTHYNF